MNPTLLVPHWLDLLQAAGYRVAVADTGIGIADQDLGTLFEPFTQVELPSHHSREGTGLGLAIARRLVQAMGGTIGVESKLGQGSTFWIEVRGRQTHAALPWAGIDPVVVSSQIVLAFQTIISRQSDLTTAPAVVSVATIEGGNRTNIIPDYVRMSGTVRTLDDACGIHRREGTAPTLEPR